MPDIKQSLKLWWSNMQKSNKSRICCVWNFAIFIRQLPSLWIVTVLIKFIPDYFLFWPNVGVDKMDRVKRIWYLSPMRAAKVQASLRIRAVSPEPPLLAHISIESRGTFRQKARSLAPLNDWACAVEICHDGMLEDTNSLDGAHMSHWQNVK